MDGKVTHFSAWCLVLTGDMQPQGYFGADCVAARCRRQVALAAQLGHARAAARQRRSARSRRLQSSSSSERATQPTSSSEMQGNWLQPAVLVH
jgi:hypothetical protein